MSVPLLETENLSIAFGGVKAVDGGSLKVQPRRIHSIIGPNGAGKTTLFNLMSGLYQPSSGRVRLAGEDVTGLPPDALARRGLSRSFQNLQIFFRMSALDNVMVGRHQHEKTSLLSHIFALPSVRRENARSREIAMALLARVGLAAWLSQLPGGLDTDLGPHGTAISGGERQRLALARLLLADRRLLVLDEPTEHLDGPTADAVGVGPSVCQAASGGGVERGRSRRVACDRHRRDLARLAADGPAAAGGGVAGGGGAVVPCCISDSSALSTSTFTPWSMPSMTSLGKAITHATMISCRMMKAIEPL